VYSLLVRAPNLQILRIEQGSMPRIDRSFLLCFSCCYHERKAWYTELFSSRRFFRPLSPIVISFTTIRSHDIALPSISATIFATPKPHELTIVELRVAYTRYATGLTDRYSPVAVIKWNLLPGTADTKAPFPSELGIITVLVLLPASLGYTTTKASFPPTSILSSKLFSRVRPRRRGEAQSGLKEEFNPSCHP
jgi:hypothetical protein